jgi:hypothetical protein
VPLRRAAIGSIEADEEDRIDVTGLQMKMVAGHHLVHRRRA